MHSSYGGPMPSETMAQDKPFSLVVSVGYYHIRVVCTTNRLPDTSHTHTEIKGWTEENGHQQHHTAFGWAQAHISIKKVKTSHTHRLQYLLLLK